MKNNGLVTEVQRRELCADRNLNRSNRAVTLLEDRPTAAAIEPEAVPGSWPLSGQLKRKVVLLVSTATGFGRNLNNAADLLELGFTQIGDPARALSLTGQTRAAVVFVDLDLPILAGWNVAERLLHAEASPALILLAERTGHFDLNEAIRSGAVIDKSAGPVELLKTVSRALAELNSDRSERIARQSMLLRWLRPYDCPAPVMAAGRFQGINE